MDKIATASTEAIVAHPLFRELTQKRSRLRWICALVIVALFLGFILAICSYKVFLSTRIGDQVMPVGFAIAILMGAVSLIITAVYVRTANHSFAMLTEQLRLEVSR